MISLKGRIAKKQSITGATKKISNRVTGEVGDYINIMSRIAKNERHFSGVLKNPSLICGKIDKPSSQTPIIDGDHQFVVVDLVKMQEQITSVNNANAVVPFTVQTSQVLSKSMGMYAVPTAITVSQVTVTVDEEEES